MHGGICNLGRGGTNGQGILTLVGLCCGFVLTLAGFAAPAAADENRPNRILIEYVPPKNPEHQKIYETLKERHALEKLQEIFSPFKLPIDVTIKTVGCDGVDNAWYQRPTMTICYEYLDSIFEDGTAGDIAGRDNAARCDDRTIFLHGRA